MVDQLRPSYVAGVAGSATPEVVFAATTDAVQWVQIYGITRLKDANDKYILKIKVNFFYDHP